MRRSKIWIRMPGPDHSRLYPLCCLGPYLCSNCPGRCRISKAIGRVSDAQSHIGVCRAVSFSWSCESRCCSRSKLPGGLWNRRGDGSCHTLDSQCCSPRFVTISGGSSRGRLRKDMLTGGSSGNLACIHAFCHKRLQTRIATASHQIEQRWRSISSADFGCPESISFSRFFVKSILLQSGAFFLELIFRKCSGPVSFFNPKRDRVSCPGVFSPVIHTLLNCYTSQLLDDAGGWHDDVVDMTVCVLTMTIVRNSEVF